MSGSAASDQADQEEYEDRMMGAGPSQPQQGLPMAQADTPTPQQLSQQPSPYANTPDPYQQPQQAIPTGGTIDQNQFEDPQAGQSFGFTPPPAPPAPTPKSSWASDALHTFNAAALGSVQDIVGAASLVDRKLTADPISVRFLEQAKANLQGHIENQIGDMSAAQQKAFHASLFSDGSDPNAPSVAQAGYARYAATALVNLLPTAATMVLPGGLAGKVALGIASKVGLAADTAATVAKVAGLVTTAQVGGMQDAGAAYNETVNQVDNASDKTMMQSPAYAHLRETGMSVDDAKRSIVGSLAMPMLGHYIAGAAGAVGVGGLLGKGAAGVADGAGTAIRALIGGGEGAATMGAQSGADDAIQQSQNETLGTQSKFDPEALARAVAGGAIGGAVLGGAGGVLHGGAHGDIQTEAGEDKPIDTASPTGQTLDPTKAPVGASDPVTSKPVDPQAAAAMKAPTDAATAPAATPAVPTAENGPNSTAPVAPDLHAALAEGLGTTPPEPTPPAPKPAPVTRKDFINALVDGGAARKDVAGLKLVDLKAQHDALLAKQNPAATPQTPESTPAPAPAPAPAVPEGMPTPQAPSAPAGEGAPSPLSPLHPDNAPPPPPAPVAPSEPAGVDRPPGELSPMAPQEPTAVTMPQPEAVQDATAPNTSVVETPGSPRELDAPVAGGSLGGTSSPDAGSLPAQERAAPSPVLPDRSEPGAPAASAPAAKPLTVADTLRAQAAAKRAAGKAKWAPPGARMKGTVVTVGDEGKGLEAGTEGRNPQEVRQDIIDASSRAARVAGLPPALHDSLKQAALGAVRDSPSESEAHDALAEFFKSNAGKNIPGSRVKFGDAGQTVMQLLRGKGLDEPAMSPREAELHADTQDTRVVDAAEEARANASDKLAEGGSRYDADEARGQAHREQTEDERAGELGEEAGGEDGPSTQVTQDYGTAPREESSVAASVTNTAKIGANLMRRLLSDHADLDLAEAHDEFGDASEDGRPRAYKNLSDYIQKQIDTAPAREREVLSEQADRLADMQAAREQSRRALKPGEKPLKPPTTQAMSALTRRVDRVMAEVDPEHLDRLRDLKDRLDQAVEDRTSDPVGYEARRELERQGRGETSADSSGSERISRPLYRRDVEPGGAGGQSEYVRALADPRINSVVSSRLADNELNRNRPSSAHELYRLIANNARIKSSMRPMAALADHLLKVAPDIEVHSQDSALDHGLLSQKEYDEDYASGDTYGSYNPTSGGGAHIILHNNPSRPASMVETLLHEGLHSVTADHITMLEKLDRSNPQAQALQAIMEELSRHYNTAGREFQASQTGRDLGYALSDIHELHTGLMSGARLQELAASLPASDQLRARLAELGFGQRPAGTSVWRHFTDWVRRAVGLGPSGSASETSLLDHILHPLQDVTDSAVRLNRSMDALAPSDPVLRQHAEPLFRAATTVGKPLLGRALDLVDRPGIGDRVREAALASQDLDNMVDRNRELMGRHVTTDAGSTDPDKGLVLKVANPLEYFRQTTEAIQNSSNAYDRQFRDRVGTLGQRLAGRDDLGQLMVDATIGKTNLGEANPHLTDPDAIKASEALQARFAGLSKADRDTVKGAQALYTESYRAQRDAYLKGMIGNFLPDATPEQVKALSQVTRSKTTLDEFIRTGDDATLARAFSQGWEDSRSIAQGIAKVQRMGFVEGGYFPLRRFGDYTIRYGDPDNLETYGMERFEKRGDADARYAELKAQGVEGLSTVQLRNEGKLGDLTGKSDLVNRTVMAIAKKHGDEQAEQAREMMQKVMLEYATKSEAAVAKRRGVKGASIDQSRVMAQEHLSASSRVGYAEHSAARQSALSMMRLVAEDLGRRGSSDDTVRAQQVYRELVKRSAANEDLGGAMAALARRATSFSFTQSLMSPSHMVTSSIESHTNASALLGARHGYTRATLALSKAMADVTPRLAGKGLTHSLAGLGGRLKQADWDLSKHAQQQFVRAGAKADHMKTLFDQLDRANLIDHTMVRETQRLANPSGAIRSTLGKSWQRFSDFNAAGAHAVDVANKSAIAKATFDLELRRNGGDVDRAATVATDTLRRATPNYNFSNKARIATSAGPLKQFAGPLMQFKNYGIHQYGMMANLVRASMQGATKAERWEARKAFAGVLATHAAMAGTLTLLADPLRLIGGAYDWATSAKSPHDYENSVRGWMSDTFGPELGQVIARGLPEAAGIDIHRRVGLSNMLELPDINTFDAKGYTTALMQIMSGATAENFGNEAAGVSKLLQGDPSGFQLVVPRPIRDMMKAANLATTGVTNSKTGQVELPASQISTGSVIAQGLGFQPSRVSEFREGHYAVQEAMQEAQQARSGLTQKFLQADPADRTDVWAEIQQYNAQNPTAPIQYQSLLRALNQRMVVARQAAANPGSFGVRLPRGDTSALTSAGRFANVGG